MKEEIRPVSLEVRANQPRREQVIPQAAASGAFAPSGRSELATGVGGSPLYTRLFIAGMPVNRVIFDEGSSVNILYAHSLDLIGIRRLEITAGPDVLSVNPGRRITPLGQITLDTSFGKPGYSRYKQLPFIVIDQQNSHHVILGKPFFDKF